MTFEIEDVAYSPLRREYVLKPRTRTQVLVLGSTLSTPSEEFYKKKDRALPRSEAASVIPKQALDAFALAVVSLVEQAIAANQNVVDPRAIERAWTTHVAPHYRAPLASLEWALGSVRVSTEKLQEESRSQLTTAREIVVAAVEGGLYPGYFCWDTESANTVDRYGIRLALDLAYAGRIKHVMYADMTRASRQVKDGIVMLGAIHAFGVRIWYVPVEERRFEEAQPSSIVGEVVLAKELAYGQQERTRTLMRSEKTRSDLLLGRGLWPHPHFGHYPFLRVARNSPGGPDGLIIEQNPDSLREAGGVHALLTHYGPEANNGIARVLGFVPHIFARRIGIPALKGNLVTRAARAVDNPTPNLAVYSAAGYEQIQGALREWKPARHRVDEGRTDDWRKYRDLHSPIARFLASGGLDTPRCGDCHGQATMDYVRDEFLGPDLKAVFECPAGHVTLYPPGNWTLKIAGQETPQCPVCRCDRPCQLLARSEHKLRDWRTGADAIHVLFWYSCPQCGVDFPLPWEFKGELLRTWIKKRELPLRTVHEATRNGWDIAGIKYEHPEKRRPRFKPVGQRREPSKEGYWLAEDLVQLAAYHIQSWPKMRHSLQDVVLATRGAIPDRIVDLGTGWDGATTVKNLGMRARRLLAIVHGRSFVASQRGRYATYELEETGSGTQ